MTTPKLGGLMLLYGSLRKETGAEHCQHDNPTLGQEIIADWLADIFKIDQTKLSFNP